VSELVNSDTCTRPTTGDGEENENEHAKRDRDNLKTLLKRLGKVGLAARRCAHVVG
jgi:hypothetical protein